MASSTDSGNSNILLQGLTKRFDSVSSLSSWRGTLLTAHVDGFAFPYKYIADSTEEADGIYSLNAKGSNGTTPGRWLNTSPSQNVLEFGARSDSSTDNTEAFRKAFAKGGTVLIPPSPSGTYYKFSDFIITEAKQKLTIISSGAVIKNSDLTKASFLFRNCQNVSLEGGAWGYVTTPTANGGNSQHVVQFDKSSRCKVNQVHILNSPEMGIAITQSENVKVTNSLIEHCFRDGTYAHHSLNVKYINNTYKEIKDDAMSFHDYGLDTAGDRSYMVSTIGISQAQTCVVEACVVNKAYQGFASVGAKNIKVTKCDFKNTVLAGVALMNQQYGALGGVVQLNDVSIDDNTFSGCCMDQTINGVNLVNIGQSSTGRASIVCASLNGTNNSIVPLGQPKRQSDIRIRNNTVLGSGALGLHISTADRVTVSNNTFKDCTVTGSTLGGSVVEMWEVTSLVEESTNTVIDTRNTIQHQNGIAYDGVTGVLGNWLVTNKTGQDILINNSPTLTNQTIQSAIRYKIPRPQTSIDSMAATDWNTFKAPGNYQVSGTGWGSAGNIPSTVLANAGTLSVEVANDSLIQTYVDYLGNKAYRHLNGLSSSVWSGWAYELIPFLLNRVPVPSEVPVNAERMIINTDTWVRKYFNAGGTLFYTNWVI